MRCASFLNSTSWRDKPLTSQALAVCCEGSRKRFFANKTKLLEKGYIFIDIMNITVLVPYKELPSALSWAVLI
jgi:hypothetical protein